MDALASFYHRLGASSEQVAGKKLAFVELFCGTAAMTQHTVHFNIEKVLTVDKDEGCEPTFACDVGLIGSPDCKFTTYVDDLIKQGYVILMHASPPCNAFSRMNTTGARDITGSMVLVEKAVSIMKQYSAVWCLENPATGLLWDQSYSQEHLNIYADVDYCAYGGIIKKSTRFAFSSAALKNKFNPKVCPGRSTCTACIQNPVTRRFGHANWDNIGYSDRITIPPQLCMSILNILVAHALECIPPLVDYIRKKELGLVSMRSKKPKTGPKWKFAKGDTILYISDDKHIKPSALNISMCEGLTGSRFVCAILVKEVQIIDMREAKELYIVHGQSYVGTFDNMVTMPQQTFAVVKKDDIVLVLKDDDEFVTDEQKERILQAV